MEPARLATYGLVRAQYARYHGDETRAAGTLVQPAVRSAGITGV